jgi:hypothetical protein
MKAYLRKPPCGHHVHAAMAMVLPWKIEERFSKFRKEYETLTLTLYISILQEMGLKSSHWSCLKTWFYGYTFCFTTFLIRQSTGAQQNHERAPKTFQWPWKIKVLSTSSKFRLCASLKMCDLQFWGKNASEVTSTKKHFFLKNLNFVQSFVECKVSLTDGI